MIDKDKKQAIIADFKLSETDTGSTAVQVALITARIKELTAHIGDNKKDYSSKHGMLKLVSQRKKLLSYLRKKNVEAYNDVVKRLGLRK